MKKLLLTLLCASTGLIASANQPAHKEPGEGNQFKDKAHSSFEENAPDDLKGAVPHFAIFGKEDKFYLGVGGSVKLTAGVDLGDPIDNANEFVTSDILPVGPGDHSKFNLSAQQSSIFLNFVALPDTKNQIGAFFMMNFFNNYAPVVQYAYLKYRGLRAGYDYSIFSNMGAMPATIDYEGPNASTAYPLPTISYTQTWGKAGNWSTGIGVELSQLSQTNSGRTRSVNQGVPDIPIDVRYAWGKSHENWVKASAIMRNLYYFNDHAGKNIDILGWGVSLSGTAEIIPSRLRGYWTGTYGHGIASYIQDLSGLGLDLTPTGGPGRDLKATRTWGAFGGFELNLTEDVYFTTSYSHVRNYADPWTGGTQSYGETYKYAQYVNATLFWNINSILSTGAEYLYGRRVNNDRSQAHTNRIQAMVQVSF